MWDPFLGAPVATETADMGATLSPQPPTPALCPLVLGGGMFLPFTDHYYGSYRKPECLKKLGLMHLIQLLALLFNCSL